MRSRLKSFVRIALSICLAFLFLYLAFRGSDFHKLVSSLKEANYLWAFLLIPSLMISHLFRAWRWKYLLGPIKSDVSFRNLFSSIMVGYMVNNALPRVGEIVRPYNLGNLEKISKSAVFGTVLVERIIDVLSFLLFLAVIFFFYQSSLAQIFPWLGSAGLITGIITLSVFGFFGLFLARRDLVFRWIRKFTGWLPSNVQLRLERLLHSFLDGFLIIREPRRYLIILVLSLFIWLWYAIMVYLPFHAFEMVGRYSLDFVAAVVTMVMSAIAFIIPVPGATGTYHWIAKETLVRLYGVEVEVALSYATVSHLLGYVSVTFVGIIYFLRDNLKFSEALRTQAEEKEDLDLARKEET